MVTAFIASASLNDLFTISKKKKKNLKERKKGRKILLYKTSSNLQMELNLQPF